MQWYVSKKDGLDDKLLALDKKFLELRLEPPDLHLQICANRIDHHQRLVAIVETVQGNDALCCGREYITLSQHFDRMSGSVAKEKKCIKTSVPDLKKVDSKIIVSSAR